ncbi:SWIM-type domain-containing protein [Trichonephila clavipes]|nr:SWIM-type domain-containing protein [Trichonephila clavipes]
MIPQTSEEVFIREPAIEVENEIGFDFTAAPFFTSPLILMEVRKNMQEIKFKETILLPAFVCSSKIATDLPQMGLEEIIFYHRHYSKSIDKLTALENRTVQQNCMLTNIPAVRYGLENEDYVRHMVQQCNPHYVVRKTGLVVHPIEQYIAASPDGLIRSGEDYYYQIQCQVIVRMLGATAPIGRMFARAVDALHRCVEFESAVFGQMGPCTSHAAWRKVAHHLRRVEPPLTTPTLVDFIFAIEGFNFDAGAEQFGKIGYFWSIRAVFDLKIKQRHRGLCSIVLHLRNLNNFEAFGFYFGFNVFRLRIGGKATDPYLNRPILLQHEAFKFNPRLFEPATKVNPVVRKLFSTATPFVERKFWAIPRDKCSQIRCK